MAPVTDHAITVKIGGVDRSDNLLRDSLFIRSSVANGTDVAEFQITGITPSDWDEVTVEVDGTRIFGGYIVQRQGDSVGAGAAKLATWQVSCKDWSILLDRVLVNKQYKLTDDADIVASLFSVYLSGEGFDAATNVSTVRADIDINFEEITLREALNTLAGRANAAWHIAPDKSLYWYAPSSPAAAAFDISQTPDNTTTFGALENSVKRSVDASQIINRVRVIGSESKSTALQVDSWTANGVDSVFGPLTKKPHTLWLVQYTVEPGGTPTNVSAYASQIGIEPDDQLLADGGTFTVLANMENRTVKITDVGGLLPKNGTDVTVKYYYSTPIEITRNDTASQTAFGRVFETSIYDENLSSRAEARAYADKILEEYAYGRETISFDVARAGLLPGRLITVENTTLGLSDDYLITEVQFTAVMVRQDQFMVVCSVQAGKATQTLIESLLPFYSAGAGRIPNPSEPNRINKIAADLGDIVAGRAVFTDGGTARFDWGTPNAATGVVLGLEDHDNNAYGAVYIYEGGDVRAKLGRMTGLPDIGSVTPTGWGLYTTNGYFQGRVVASLVQGGTVSGGLLTGGTVTGAQVTGGTVTGAQVEGGTVTGGLLTGGTVVTSAGTIAGFTMQSNHLWSHGGTISTGSVVNSSNPGVYLTDSGLFGFGTLGMSFGLWTDPAKAPWISSGTINNVVYEVYEAGVIRTGPDVFNDGGIQMDNSGLFGINPITGFGRMLLEDGDKLLLEDGRGIALYGLKFSLDTVTGGLVAEDAVIHGAIYAREGRFTGTVQASQIQGGTITGAVIAGQVISGSDLVGGTITGIPIADAGITNGSLDSSLILGGTMTAAQIVGGTVTAATFTGGALSNGTISASKISGGTVTAATFTGGNLSNGTISAAKIVGGTVTAATFTGGALSNGTISASKISGGTVTAATFTGGNLSNGTISAAKISGGTVTAATFTGGTVTQGTVSAARISGGTVSGALISGGTVSGAVFSGGTVTQGAISASQFSGGTVSAASGSVTLSNAGIVFTGVAGTVNNPVYVQWRNSGTTIARYGAFYDGGGNTGGFYETGGILGTLNGFKQTSIFGYVGATPYAAHHYHAPNYFQSVINGTTVMYMTDSYVNLNTVRPNTTSSTLGDWSGGWKYLYLQDTDGYVWRMSLTPTGVITLGKL